VLAWPWPRRPKAQNIPVIAYDRPITGADYYVSFDNFTVGALEGQSIVDGLTAAGKDPKTAIVIYMGGRPDRRQREVLPRRCCFRHGSRWHQASQLSRPASGMAPSRRPTSSRL